MPFTVPWTRGTPTEVARSVLTYQWGARASASPEKWNLELAVVRDGEVLGTQALTAHDFPVTRTAETGSWLGLRHHGQGIGTRMRLMILHLLFEGFDGLRATTSAFDDNAPRTASPAGSATPRTASTSSPARGGPRRAVGTCWTARRGTARPAELRPEVTLVGVDGRPGAARHLTRELVVGATDAACRWLPLRWPLHHRPGSAVAEVP